MQPPPPPFPSLGSFFVPTNPLSLSLPFSLSLSLSPLLLSFPFSVCLSPSLFLSLFSPLSASLSLSLSLSLAITSYPMFAPSRIMFHSPLLCPLSTFTQYLSIYHFSCVSFPAICNPPCSKGGTCTQPNTCACSSGYIGSQCQTGKCPWKNCKFLLSGTTCDLSKMSGHRCL